MAAITPAPPAEPAISPAIQLELDRLRALVDFPLADRDILYMVSGDTAQIRAAAEKLQKQAQAALPPTAVPVADPPPTTPPTAVTPPPPAVPPAQPLPTPGPGIVQPPSHVEDARKEELRRKVELRIADELERNEAFQIFLRDGWNEHVAKLNARPGRS